MLAASMVVLATAGTGAAAPRSTSTSPAVAHAGSVAAAAVQLAQCDECKARQMQAHHGPASQGRRSSYNDEYIFGLTRGIADSTMHPAAKILVFPMTVPLDFALLPFEVIGGLF